MAGFPTYAKNATVATQPVVVTPPANLSGATAEERILKQQWKDVAQSGLGARHPLSINRDNGTYVTNANDPYTS